MGNIERMGEKRNSYRILVWQPVEEDLWEAQLTIEIFGIKIGGGTIGLDCGSEMQEGQ